MDVKISVFYVNPIYMVYFGGLVLRGGFHFVVVMRCVGGSAHTSVPWLCFTMFFGIRFKQTSGGVIGLMRCSTNDA